MALVPPYVGNSLSGASMRELSGAPRQTYAPLSARLRLHQEPLPAQERQAPVVHAPSLIFAGNCKQNLVQTSRCRNAVAKDKAVAERTGTSILSPRFGPTGFTPLAQTGKSILAAAPKKEGKRCFTNTPMQQSVVDQVVFGRDMDFSGEDQFDEGFTKLFEGGAGLTSMDVARIATVNSIRPFPNVPTMQSIVDQVVFGRDMDGSGEVQFDEEFLRQYEGAAGCPTIKPG